MEEKERYYYKKILRDCVIPEGFYEINDRESDFYLIIENKKDIDTITNLLNQQDKQINQLKQQLHDLPKKIVEEIKKVSDTAILGNGEIYDYTITAKNLDTILKKYGGENE